MPFNSAPSIHHSQGGYPGQVPVTGSTSDTPLSAESGRPEQYVGFWAYYPPSAASKGVRGTIGKDGKAEKGAKWYEK